MSIVISGSQIPKLKQTVVIGGAFDSRFRCTGITLGSGFGATEARFEIPGMYWDDSRDWLRDKLLIVNNGSGTDFVGYASVDTANAGPNNSNVSFSAYSITKWLSKVHVGQDQNIWEYSYPFINKQTGQKTQWTPVKILRDLFAAMPSQYKNHIKIGITGPLNDIGDIEAPDITFRLVDYASAINQLLSLFGDVAVKERFVNSDVYIDFYRINEANSATTNVRVSLFDNPRYSGANVEQLNYSENSTETVTRVIGIGAYRRFMVTCKSIVTDLENPENPSDPNKSLIKWWDSALEPIVLKNPKIASSNTTSYTFKVKGGGDSTTISGECGIDFPIGGILISPTGEQLLISGFNPKETIGGEEFPAECEVERGYNGTTTAEIKDDDVLKLMIPGIEHVFRRYKLPPIFNVVNVLKENCKQDTDGNFLPIQVWRRPSALYPIPPVEGQDDGGMAGSILPTPKLVDGVSLKLDQGYFVLSRAAVEPVMIIKEKDDAKKKGKTITTYHETTVGITFSYEDKRVPFMHDTGVKKDVVRFDFADDGLTERWQKNEMMYCQAGNLGFPLYGLLFGCVWIDDKTKQVEVTSIEEFKILRDDLPQIKAICEQTLREKNRRVRSYQIDIPYFTRGYQIGSRVRVLGDRRGDMGEVYKVTSINYNLPIGDKHSTTISIDNVKPPFRQSTQGAGHD